MTMDVDDDDDDGGGGGGDDGDGHGHGDDEERHLWCWPWVCSTFTDFMGTWNPKSTQTIARLTLGCQQTNTYEQTNAMKRKVLCPCLAEYIQAK